MPAGLSDEQHRALMTQIAKGDRRALDTLYRDIENSIFRFLLTKINDSYLAADILHDVFLEVWRSAGRFEGRSKVKTWVFGIAYRKVIDVYRKSSRIDFVDEVPEQIDTSASAEQCLLAAQESVHLRHCLEELKAPQRSVIEMAFFEDLNYREIAEATDVPEGTVKTRVFHAKRLLLRCLQGRLHQGGVV